MYHSVKVGHVSSNLAVSAKFIWDNNIKTKEYYKCEKELNELELNNVIQHNEVNVARD